MLFGTQEFKKTLNITKLKLLLTRYKTEFSPLCFNASFDHHRFFFSKCDIIKDSVEYNDVGIALFRYEKLTNLQLSNLNHHDIINWLEKHFYFMLYTQALS